jgi:UDP-MurNAc hydroxylase
MRATSIGHAGILIETDAGSILCDPWFVPAFFGSWFVFPRNDQLSDDLRARIEQADYLYITHLHGDHHDEPWLREHLRRDIPILLPGYPTGSSSAPSNALGFTEFIRTVDGEEMELAPGLTIAIHTEVSITDGPGGDSAMVVSDGRTRLVNQNDCRTTDLDALRRHGPGRSALAPVLGGDLVPDGLRGARRRDASARRRQGGEPVHPRHAVRRPPRRPRRRAERRTAGVPRRRSVGTST